MFVHHLCLVGFVKVTSLGQQDFSVGVVLATLSHDPSLIPWTHIAGENQLWKDVI